MWVRDVHRTAEILKVMLQINKNYIDIIGEENEEWFRSRLSNFYNSWLNDRKILDIDIGICCPRCQAFPGCNLFPILNFVDGMIDEDTVIKILEKMLKCRHNNLWYYSEAEGFNEITPHVSSLVLNFLISKRKYLLEKNMVKNFDKWILESTTALLSLQNEDGSWPHPTNLKGLMPDEEEYRGHVTNDMYPIILFLHNSVELMPQIKNEIEDSLSKAMKYLLSVRDVDHWSCITHCEDRNLYSMSNIRGTSYAIQSLLSCGKEPFSNEITAGIQWLIQNQTYSGAWPLDTEVNDIPSISSTKHAILTLYKWIKSVGLKFESIGGSD